MRRLKKRENTIENLKQNPGSPEHAYIRNSGHLYKQQLISDDFGHLHSHSQPMVAVLSRNFLTGIWPGINRRLHTSAL